MIGKISIGERIQEEKTQHVIDSLTWNQTLQFTSLDDLYDLWFLEIDYPWMPVKGSGNRLQVSCLNFSLSSGVSLWDIGSCTRHKLGLIHQGSSCILNILTIFQLQGSVFGIAGVGRGSKMVSTTGTAMHRDSVPSPFVAILGSYGNTQGMLSGSVSSFALPLMPRTALKLNGEGGLLCGTCFTYGFAPL